MDSDCQYINRRTRQEALRERVVSLMAVGESFLAETELKGRILYDPDPVVRTEAARCLAEIYSRERDTEAQQRLAAADLLTDPSGEQLAKLAAAAADNSDWNTALLACLATPPEQRSADLLLQATYQQGWWQVFQRTLSQTPDTELREYWHALWLIHLGDYASATQRLTFAGERGVRLKNHIVRGHKIVDALRSTDLDRRLLGIRQWEEWVATHPGPHCWRKDESIVRACERIDQVAFEPGEPGARMYRASAHQPVLLHVSGPVDLQIEARPLHDHVDREPLNDWLVVRGSGRELVWPITENRPADSLQLLTDPLRQPGRKVTTQLHLGPGTHELQVAAEASELLVRMAIRQPLCSLAMLPPISPATLAAVANGSWGRKHVDDVSAVAAAAPRHVSLIVTDREIPAIVNLPWVRQIGEEETIEAPLSPVVTASQRSLLGLREGTITASEANRELAASRTTKALRSDELLELAARAGVDPADLPAVADPQLLIDWQWMSVFHGRLQQALQVDPGSDQVALHAHVAILVRWAEQQPLARPACAARLAELAKQWPFDRFIAAQLGRIKEPGEWVLFREVDASGGLYELPESGPQPMIQSAQVRRALADPVALHEPPADYLISGYRQLDLDSVESRPVLIEFVLHQPRISFLTAPQLRVELQVDQSASRRVTLPERGDAQRIQVPLPAGKHRIRLRIENPFAGHYVFVNVNEIDAAGKRTGWQDRANNETAERLYHVATPSMPVQLQVQGPSWIRVERVVEGQREIEETSIVAGSRQLTFAAPPGVKHALYRIWEYQFGQSTPEPPVFRTSATPLTPPSRWLEQTDDDPVFPDLGGMASAVPSGYVCPPVYPELAALAPADAPASQVAGLDAYPLRGLGNGTWGFGTGLFKRRALEEGQQFTGDDRFLQLLLSYERFDEDANTYSLTQGLFRLRDASGPSFGLVHEYWSPLETLLERLPTFASSDDAAATSWLEKLKTHNLLSAFFQQPSDPLPFYDRQTEASLGWRGRVYYQYDLTERWYHLPSLTLIARWLSMDRTSYLPSRVDQDIFTPFKNDQRVALYLTDTWAYAPSETGRIWLRPAVYTNEDLNPFRPDHISLHTGIAGLSQNVDWQLAYRIARFFQDDDRQHATTQNLLYWDAILDHWSHAGSRYELAVNVRYQVEDNKTSAFITLTRFLSRGRGYRDHHPSEVGFRSLRERAAFPTWQFYEPFGL